MRIVADKTLAFLVRSMKHRALLNLMALRAQVAFCREQCHGRFVFLRDDVVAVLTAHPDCRMDEPSCHLLGMAGQARLRFDIPWFDEGMLNRFFGAHSKGQKETNDEERSGTTIC
jgi:hypothetical protein